MRKSMLCLIMGSLLAVTGCSLSASEPPPDTQSDYSFTRDGNGQAVQASVSTRDFEPAQSFDHSLTSEREDAAAGLTAPQDCSGVCDANTCLCSGDLNCCIVGCGLCFILVAN